jgi:hypothetical protein
MTEYKALSISKTKCSESENAMDEEKKKREWRRERSCWGLRQDSQLLSVSWSETRRERKSREYQRTRTPWEYKEKQVDKRTRIIKVGETTGNT